MASPPTSIRCHDRPGDGAALPLEQTLGIDIGGAHLKLSDASGRSLSVAFPMWSDALVLSQAVQVLLQRFQTDYRCRVGHLGVTMTGELADCFPTRREGVRCILEQLAKVFPTENTRVYAVGGPWLSPAEAAADAWGVAASNWYALAEWVHRSQVWRVAGTPEHELLAVVDIGSTTVDVIPINADGIATSARTDRERLQLGQLIYTGMQRTPVASILSSVRLEHLACPLMAERFATSDDAYLALGLVPDVPNDHDTADGRARTKRGAQARLARMIGEDIETLSVEQIESMAWQVVGAQAERVAAAVNRNLAHSRLARRLEGLPPALLISGHGRPLFERVQPLLDVPQCRLVWLEELLSPAAARSGPAMAIAWLLEHSTQP